MKGLLFFLMSPALSVCSPKFVRVTQTVTITAGAEEAYQPTTNPVAPSSTPVVQPPQSTLNTVVTPATPTGGTKNPSGTYSSDESSGNTYNDLPPAAVINFKSPDIFADITQMGQKGQAVIKNSCSYPIHITSAGCGQGAQNFELAPGKTWSEATRNCNTEGVQLQVTTPDKQKPMLVEYGADANGGIFYDLSHLVCMKPNSTDLTPCTGHEAGNQCGSAQGCPVFACSPGTYCDRTSYTVPEYGLTKDNAATRQSIAAPVGRCALENGVVWEVCAGNGKGARKY